MISGLIKDCMEFEVRTGCKPLVSMRGSYFSQVYDSEKKYIKGNGFIDSNGQCGIGFGIPYYIDNEQKEDFVIHKYGMINNPLMEWGDMVIYKVKLLFEIVAIIVFTLGIVLSVMMVKDSK